MFSADLCQPARGGNFVIAFININKDTSSSENVHLCLRKKRQLGHISVATDSISSLFCAFIDVWCIEVSQHNQLVANYMSMYQSIETDIQLVEHKCCLEKHQAA